MTVLASLPLARVNTAALLSAVTDASKAAGAKYAVPVLTGLRLHQLANGMLEVSGFNYETSITRRVPVDGQVPDVVLPGAMLRTMLKKLDAKEPLTLAMEDAKFVITQNRKRIALTPLALEDYPDLPKVPRGRDFTVTGADLHTVATKVAVFAGKDEYLPVLTGVRFEVVDGVLHTAATDRYRLAHANFRARMPVKPRDKELTCLLPEVALIGTLLKDAANVAVSFVDGTAFFHSDECTVTQRMLDGEFPKYRSLFPAETSTTAVVDPTALHAAVKFAAEGCERNTPVRLTVAADQVEVASTSGEDDVSDAVEAVIAGGAPFTIGVNPGYLMDALKVWEKGHAVCLGMNTDTKPILFTSPAADNMRVLLMPVRINR